MAITTPVAFLIFNRPEVSRRVFEQIARAKPRTLFVVGDGPRPEAGEEKQVEATRAILNRVDWPCELLTNYSDVNLGCRKRISSGLQWVFQNVPEAIVLEDDCLPSPSFFGYCQQLLQRYRDDDRIMAISGSNYQFGRWQTPHSYYFSKYFHCWGWASWRRAWEKYDVDMKTWPEFQQAGCLRWLADSPIDEQYWHSAFDRTYRGEIDTWAYQWSYASFSQRGLTVLPSTNLISNIGFGQDATHTSDTLSPVASMPRGELGELSHPPIVVRHRDADMATFPVAFLQKPVGIRNRWKSFIRKHQRSIQKRLPARWKEGPRAA